MDQENKRLQAELELLQNKYESLSNLHTRNANYDFDFKDFECYITNMNSF